MKAYELLAKPEAWTQNAYARNAKGKKVDFDSREAVAWCCSGAIRLVTGEKSGPFPASNKSINRAAEAIGCTVINWNDHPGRTHSEVVALLKELDI